MSPALATLVIVIALALALAEQAWEWIRLGRMARNIKQQQEEEQS